MRRAFGWVHRVAAILADDAGAGGATVRRRLRGLLGALSRHAGSTGRLAPALAHFLKVTRSYWPALFACYDVEDLPRTNNELEQFLGTHRYHERLASGRRTACDRTVVRGSVRLVASAATRLGRVAAMELVPTDMGRWRPHRRELENRRDGRTWGHRFRHDPKTYLRKLEETLIKSALPPQKKR